MFTNLSRVCRPKRAGGSLSSSTGRCAIRSCISTKRPVRPPLDGQRRCIRRDASRGARRWRRTLRANSQRAHGGSRSRGSERLAHHVRALVDCFRQRAQGANDVVRPADEHRFFRLRMPDGGLSAWAGHSRSARPHPTDAARIRNICELGVRTFGWAFRNPELDVPSSPRVRLRTGGRGLGTAGQRRRASRRVGAQFRAGRDAMPGAVGYAPRCEWGERLGMVADRAMFCQCTAGPGLDGVASADRIRMSVVRRSARHACPSCGHDSRCGGSGDQPSGTLPPRPSWLRSPYPSCALRQTPASRAPDQYLPLARQAPAGPSWHRSSSSSPGSSSHPNPTKDRR